MFRKTYTMRINCEHVSAALAVLDMTEVKVVDLVTDAFDDHSKIIFKANKNEVNKVIDRLNKYVGEAYLA